MSLRSRACPRHILVSSFADSLWPPSPKPLLFLYPKWFTSVTEASLPILSEQLFGVPQVIHHGRIKKTEKKEDSTTSNASRASKRLENEHGAGDVVSTTSPRGRQTISNPGNMRRVLKAAKIREASREHKKLINEMMQTKSDLSWNW